MLICNEVDNLVHESGVAGHKSEVMRSPVSPRAWRGFPFAVAARPRLYRIRSDYLRTLATVSNLALGKDPPTW